jgi:uncharacterized protein
VTDPVRPSSDFPPLDRSQILIGMAVTAVVLMAIARFIQWLGNVPLMAWRLDSATLLLGGGLGLGITVASLALFYLWPAYRNSAKVYLNMVLEPLVLPDVLWLGLLPGLSEELLFRGVMVPALGGGLVAIAVAGICFGLSHMSGKAQWPYAAWASVVGIGLGVAAVATGNLLVPVIAHTVANLLSSTFWKLTHQTEAGEGA